MVLVKSFFRKKTSKIYLLLFSVLILGLIVVYSFINYYDIAVNDYLKNNLVITFASSKDYYSDLINDNRIEEVKVGKIIMPDYNNKTLIKSSEETNFSFNEETNDYVSSGLYWDNFLIDDSFTVLYPANSNKISGDEIVLSFPITILNSKQTENINNIIGKKLAFLNNGQSIELTIKDIENKSISNIIVSDDMYKNINSRLNYYQITLSDYKEASNVREKILHFDYDKNYNVVKKSYEYSESQGMISLIDFLKMGSLIGIVLLFIILFITSNNILKDDRRNIYVERLVGFNKKSVAISLIINMLLLITLSMLIAILFSIFTLYLINSIFNITVVMFDISLLITIFILIEFTSIIEMLIFSIQINKCLKKDYMKF